MHTRARGFNLIEMLIVMVILSLLAVVAVPSFMDQIRKTRRADAFRALSAVQLAQERWRGSNPSYATLVNLGLSATSPDGRYTLALSNVSATGYTASATAVSGSSQVNDRANGVSCATLRVNQDAPVYSPAGQAACWGR